MGTGIERVVLAEVDPEDLSSMHAKCQYLWEEFFIQHPKMNELMTKASIHPHYYF